jgi:hypothetical protein
MRQVLIQPQVSCLLGNIKHLCSETERSVCSVVFDVCDVLWSHYTFILRLWLEIKKAVL